MWRPQRVRRARVALRRARVTLEEPNAGPNSETVKVWSGIKRAHGSLGGRLDRGAGRGMAHGHACGSSGSRGSGQNRHTELFVTVVLIRQSVRLGGSVCTAGWLPRALSCFVVLTHCTMVQRAGTSSKGYCIFRPRRDKLSCCIFCWVAVLLFNTFFRAIRQGVEKIRKLVKSGTYVCTRLYTWSLIII